MFSDLWNHSNSRAATTFVLKTSRKFVLILYIPVSNFSVMTGLNHAVLSRGLSTCNVSCSRTRHCAFGDQVLKSNPQPSISSQAHCAPTSRIDSVATSAERLFQRQICWMDKRNTCIQVLTLQYRAQKT